MEKNRWPWAFFESKSVNVSGSLPANGRQMRTPEMETSTIFALPCGKAAIQPNPRRGIDDSARRLSSVVAVYPKVPSRAIEVYGNLLRRFPRNATYMSEGVGLNSKDELVGDFESVLQLNHHAGRRYIFDHAQSTIRTERNHPEFKRRVALLCSSVGRQKAAAAEKMTG